MTASDTTPKTFFRRGNLLWLAAYVVVVTGVVLVMLQVRRVTLRSLNTPEAQAEWNAWRESPPNVRTDLPVRRHPPSSDEPPALILMRDYFPVMMAAAVVFGSLLFTAIMIAARGALWRDHDRPSSPEIGDG
jgi:hypothetical protein